MTSPGVGLHLLAGDDRSARSRASSTASSAPGEDVVVRDRDRAEPDPLRVVEEIGDGDGAVVRVLGVHVQVGEDPRPVGERVGASERPPSGACGGRRRRAVPARRRARSKLSRLGRARARRSSCSPPAPASSARRATAAADELGLLLRAGRVDERDARALASSRERARFPAPGTSPAAPASSAARLSASSAVRTMTRPRSARGTYGRPASGLVRRTTSSQPGRPRRARKTARSRGSSLGPPLEDEALPRRRGLEALESTPERQRPVVAREARGGGRRGCRARRRQRVDAAEELLALLLARRVAEALGGVERRHREPARVAQREVGEARDARLVARGRRRSGRA